MKAPAFFPIFALALLPLLARADRPPDFETDAKPIIAQQPGLLEYIHKHFEIKETGLAARGNGDQPPQPPFIFSARPKGHSGPFYLRLLIQPGSPGQIMKVADVRKLPPGAVPPPEADQPEQAIGSAPSSQAAPSQTPPDLAPPADTPAAPSQAPAASPSSGPTAATPSGPIKD